MLSQAVAAASTARDDTPAAGGEGAAQGVPRPAGSDGFGLAEGGGAGLEDDGGREWKERVGYCGAEMEDGGREGKEREGGGGDMAEGWAGAPGLGVRCGGRARCRMDLCTVVGAAAGLNEPAAGGGGSGPAAAAAAAAAAVAGLGGGGAAAAPPPKSGTLRKGGTDGAGMVKQLVG